METTPQEVIDYFHFKTEAKEPLADSSNHLDEFTNGIASFESGLQPLIDGYGNDLIPNFSEQIVIEESGIVIPALIGNRNREFSEQLSEQLDRKPTVILINHPSIASSYITARAVNQPFNEEDAANIFTIVGPRPMLLDYKVNGNLVSPYYLGVGLNNLLLSGTNTASTDDAPEIVKDWMIEQSKILKSNLDEVMEPKDTGRNNLLIVCPSGRIGKQTNKGVVEYLPRSYKFAANLADRAVFWPIGVHDSLLVNPSKPESMVYFNPDQSAHTAELEDENDIYTLHLRSVELASSALGKVRMQSRLSASGNRFGAKIKSYTKK